MALFAALLAAQCPSRTEAFLPPQAACRAPNDGASTITFLEFLPCTETRTTIRPTRRCHCTGLSQTKRRDNTSNSDEGILVLVVDQILGLFRPPTTLSFLPVPVGYLLIWSALSFLAPWTQFVLTLALYGGLKFVADQAGLNELDGDDNDNDEFYEDASSYRRGVNGDSIPRAINGDQQSPPSTTTTLPNQEMEQRQPQSPPTANTVDIFCFVASLALGTVLVSSMGPPPTLPMTTPSMSTTTLLRDALSSDTSSIVTSGLYAVGSLVVLIGGSVIVLEGFRSNNHDATTNKSNGNWTNRGINGDTSKDDEQDETNPNRRLLNLWDEQFRRMSKSGADLANKSKNRGATDQTNEQEDDEEKEEEGDDDKLSFT
eukprot:CAMPEP_0172458030 /NCGR_PEP_ID=MMETSP1065-20121228/25634_1 /TAXON_ID=265537 /ORGANISM="Amphiprora paludosa, Strain CCMP125" /LENGTH=372 /DNA_ID=CAMNT_0013212097 /DNA_START=187 /DNA_END=1305 /DNA_ORIENTATION=+